MVPTIHRLHLINKDFSIYNLPNVYRCLISNYNINKSAIKNTNSNINYIISIFHSILLFLSATKKYSDFFWWVFLYALFQKDIIEFASHFPQTQYKEISDMLNASNTPKELWGKSQVLNLSEPNLGETRKALIRSASNHLIIAGSSLKDAFNIDSDHSLISALTDALNSDSLKRVSLLLTDPIIFDAHIACGEPIRDISNTTISFFYPPIYQLVLQS